MSLPVADPDISFGGPRGAEGAEVERRRREDRGLGVGRGHWGWGLAMPPPQYSPLPRKFFQSFIKKWRVLVDSDV